MRGNAKSLKPMLTPAVERVLRDVTTLEAGLLVLWYCDQYHAFLAALERIMARGSKTLPDEVADLLDQAPRPPDPPGVSVRALAHLVTLRGEAQDMVESNIDGKLAERERKRRKAEEKKRNSAISGNSGSSAEKPENAENPESAEKPENAENAENLFSGFSSSPLESPSSETVKSVSQTTRARARTTTPFGLEDYRSAGEAAGYGQDELRRFVAVNERGILSPADAVARWNARRTPTERAGGAAAVSEARTKEDRASYWRNQAAERERERVRRSEAVGALLALADERGVDSEDGIRAIGVEVDALFGDTEAAVAAWRERGTAVPVNKLSTEAEGDSPLGGSFPRADGHARHATGSRGRTD